MYCQHWRADVPNEDSAISAFSPTFHSPCHIYGIAEIDFAIPECLSFSPRLWIGGICQSCSNRNRFFPTGCKLEQDTRRIVFHAKRPITQAECCTCEKYKPGWMAERMIVPALDSIDSATVHVIHAPPMRPMNNVELSHLQGLPEQMAVGMHSVKLGRHVEQQQIAMDLEGLIR
jgi:hypothetical protein